MPTFGVKAFVAICVLATAAFAQRNISVGNPATENFDSLGTSTINLTDNSTISGFYSTRTTGNATPNPFVAGTGSSATTQFYNFGSAAVPADRAAGSVTSGGGTGTVYHGFRLVNSGATTIGSITVTYTGEEWRRGAGGTPALNFSYQTGGTTSLTAGTWTAVAALDFTAPNQGGGQTALDGNAVGNRTTVSSTFVVNLAAGQEIMLRWANVPSGGQPWGLAIDDLSVSVVGASAADATISGRVTDSYGRAISSAAISVQDLAGKRKVAYTNTFGYYSVTGLDVGQTYVLGVSARRYTFANPSMVINLSDNFGGANFTASR